jgi:RNA polymerase sigma-70 factor, ECF subfamily
MMLALMMPAPSYPIAEDRGEHALVARARSGDHQAFECLVQAQKDSVLNVARRIVGDLDAAQDVAQETFIKAYRELRRFGGRSSFATWVYGIAVNEARMYLRSQRRRQARWQKQASWEAQGSQERTDESSEAIVALLQELPEKHRVAVALFYLEELSLAEIAQAAGAPEGTVKAWLSRGREQLRQLARERGLL